MHLIHKKFSAFALALVGLLSACSGGSGEIHTVELSNAEVVLEGPLFAGPNQGQYAFAVDLASELGDQYHEGMQIQTARLKSAEVVVTDSLGMDQLNSLVLSLASDNPEVSMLEVAFKNPLPKESATVALDLAPEAELDALLREGTVYLVLDADLAEDLLEGSRTFRVNLTFELTAK
ncbi:MAG: hypothetical protein RL104_277 [Bacteroidota bacterium]|jgi:hypothetical protein